MKIFCEESFGALLDIASFSFFGLITLKKKMKISKKASSKIPFRSDYLSLEKSYVKIRTILLPEC